MGKGYYSTLLSDSFVLLSKNADQAQVIRVCAVVVSE